MTHFVRKLSLQPQINTLGTGVPTVLPLACIATSAKTCGQPNSLVIRCAPTPSTADVDEPHVQNRSYHRRRDRFRVNLRRASGL